MLDKFFISTISFPKEKADISDNNNTSCYGNHATWICRKIKQHKIQDISRLKKKNLISKNDEWHWRFINGDSTINRRKRFFFTAKIRNRNVLSCGGAVRTYGPVLWHLLYGSEGARGPIIAESGGSPWLHPGSRGRDAPRLEDSLVAEYLLYSSQKGQSAVHGVWLEGRWPILSPCVSLQIIEKTSSASCPQGRRTRLPREPQVTNPDRPRVTSETGRMWNNIQNHWHL